MQEYTNTNGEIDFTEKVFNLKLNQTEQTFLIYSETHVYVGNLLDSISDNEFINVQKCFLSEVNNKILQVDFSVLNPNYLLILTQKNLLNLIDLHNQEKPEQTFDLNNNLPQDNKNQCNLTKFIRFAQSFNRNSLGVQALNITLIASSGHVFFLCPVFPKEIIFASENLQELSLYLDGKTQLIREDIQKLQEQQDNTDEDQSDLIKYNTLYAEKVQLLSMMILEGLQQSENPNQILINLKSRKYIKKLQEVTPQLQGPIELKIDDQNQRDKQDFRNILILKELPFSVLRVSDLELDLHLSFFQPELFFEYPQLSKQQNLYMQPDLRFQKVGKIDLQELRQNQANNKLSVSQDPFNQTQVNLQFGNSLFEINCTFLNVLEQKLLDDERISPADLLKGIRQTLLIDAETPHISGVYSNLQVLQIFIGQNSQRPPQELQIQLYSQSLLTNYQDLQKKLDNIIKSEHFKSSKPSEIYVGDKVVQIQPIPFKAEIKIPEFVFDQSKFNDELYVTQCLNKIKCFLFEQYIPQFEDIDSVVIEKMSHLAELKEEFMIKALIAQKEKRKMEEEREKLQNEIHIISQTNVIKNQFFQIVQEKINAQIQTIQRKLQGISNLGNDNFIIQLFVNKLEKQVKEAKDQLSQAKKRLLDRHQQDEKIKSLLQEVKKYEKAREIEEFIVKQKYQIEDIKKKIEQMKV